MTGSEALIFRAGWDSGKFEAGLKKMEADTQRAARNMEAAFAQFGAGVPGAGLLGRLGLGGTAIAATVAGLGAVAQAGDQTNQAIARINSALGNMGDSKAVFGELKDLASQTGIAAQDSAAQFVRYAIAARQIGATNDEVVKLISLTQKAGIISGSNAEETKNAAIQLGQALASGTLKGDELRSIMENMPLLAEQLALKLGVSIGELSKMGAEGKLTAEVVFPALLQGAGAIERKFLDMPVSISRAWGASKNALQSWLAEMDKVLHVQEIAVGYLEGLSGVDNSNREEIRQANLQRIDAEEEIARLKGRTAAMDKANEDRMLAGRLEEADLAERVQRARGLRSGVEADPEIRMFDARQDSLDKIAAIEAKTADISRTRGDLENERAVTVRLIANLEGEAQAKMRLQLATIDQQIEREKELTKEKRIQANLAAMQEDLNDQMQSAQREEDHWQSRLRMGPDERREQRRQEQYERRHEGRIGNAIPGAREHKEAVQISDDAIQRLTNAIGALLTK